MQIETIGSSGLSTQDRTLELHLLVAGFPTHATITSAVVELSSLLESSY